MQGFNRWLKRLVGLESADSESRLHQAIEACRFDCAANEKRIAENDLPPDVNAGFAASVVEKIRQHLTLAESNDPKFLINDRWKSLHEARAQELYIIPMEQVEVLVTAKAAEARSKLSEHRKEAVCALANRFCKETSPSAKRAIAVEIAQQLNESFYNRYVTVHLLGRRLSVASVVILFALVVVPLIQWLFGQSPLREFLFTYLIVIAGGLLGGALSSSISLTAQKQPSQRIPDLVAGRAIAIARLFVAVASAVVVFVLIRSGIAPVEFKFEPTELSYFGVAIVSGFSDRLVMRLISSMEGK